MTMAAIEFEEAEPVFAHVSVMLGEVVEALDPALTVVVLAVVAVAAVGERGRGERRGRKTGQSGDRGASHWYLLNGARR